MPNKRPVAVAFGDLPEAVRDLCERVLGPLGVPTKGSKAEVTPTGWLVTTPEAKQDHEVLGRSLEVIRKSLYLRIHRENGGRAVLDEGSVIDSMWVARMKGETTCYAMGESPGGCWRVAASKLRREDRERATREQWGDKALDAIEVGPPVITRTKPPAEVPCSEQSLEDVYAPEGSLVWFPARLYWRRGVLVRPNVRPRSIRARVLCGSAFHEPRWSETFLEES